MAVATLDFPDWGDPESAANMHVSTRYIEGSLPETATPNIVTAVLADYRGFDTMLETMVVFTAGLACFFILRLPRAACRESFFQYRHKPTGLVVRVRENCPSAEKTEEFERVDSIWAPQDIVIETACRFLLPFIQLFAFYVLAHGHYSPGGGFQAGVIIAASYILLAVSSDLRAVTEHMGERMTYLLSATGVLIYAGVGLFCLLAGSNFLDYGGLAGVLGMPIPSGHSLGILLVETGVALTVSATLVLIFKLLSSQGTVLEGL